MLEAMPRTTWLVLEVPPVPAAVRVARAFAAAVAQEVDPEDAELSADLALAASELVANAVQAQRRAGVGRPVLLRWGLGAEATLEVADAGGGPAGMSPVRPEAFARPEASTRPEAAARPEGPAQAGAAGPAGLAERGRGLAAGLAERGRGLLVARSLFPGLALRPNARGGTTVRVPLGRRRQPRAGPS
jgi:anti-sigma regulatory factor (Ser/Thr protein kinase)